jgi:hypothetical protein
MARAVTDGPPGREGVHEWTRFGITVAINDLTTAYNPTTDSRIILDPTRPLVLRHRSSADDNRRQRTARLGSDPLPSLPRERTATYPLLFQAPSRQALDALRTKAMYVFSDTTDLNTMRIYMPGDSLVWTYDARALGDGGLEIDETALTIDDLADGETPYQVTATLSLWVPDPRFYVEAADDQGRHVHERLKSHTLDNTGYAPTDPVFSGTRNALSADITLENLDYAVGGGHATLKFAGVPKPPARCRSTSPSGPRTWTPARVRCRSCATSTPPTRRGGTTASSVCSGRTRTRRRSPACRTGAPQYHEASY